MSFSRRMVAWLLALAVIAGASPVMAAGYAGDGPTISQQHSSTSSPTAPVQAAFDDGFANLIEDESNRRHADHGDGNDLAAIVTAALAVSAFDTPRNATVEYRTRLKAGVLFSCQKTGPPTA